MRVRFENVFSDETKLGRKIQTSEYLSVGKYPVIDQGQAQIAGYTDLEDGLFTDVPAIVFGDHTRIIKYIDSPFFLGADGVKVLKAKVDGTDYKYLFYCLQNAKIPNTGYNRHFKWLKEVKIPLPPLDEQRRIAAVLDKVSDMIAKRREQLDKLDELVKARFVEMFGDPESNPKKWNLLSFREAGVRLSDGPFGSNLKSGHYTTEGVRVIRLGNIGVGQFIDNDKSYISEQHYEKLRKYTCRSGEIVIGTLGDPNLRACLVPKTIEYAINKADCVHYIPKPEILNTRFVCQYINCPETLLLASGMVHGQTRSRISSGQLAEMPIFVPPMELQEQYAAFAEQVDKSKLTIQQSLDKMETLKKALMQEYFG